MDVFKALSELYVEKKRLDTAISALEARLAILTKPDGTVRGRRGRRSMGSEEREEVSKRMSKYWAERRASKRRMQLVPALATYAGPIEMTAGAINAAVRTHAQDIA